MKISIGGKELTELDPKNYGLTPKDILMEDKPGHFVLVKNRKSRIIMKDGTIILNKAGLIRASGFNGRISFATTAPVCSKTTAFLKTNDIKVLKLEID